MAETLLETPVEGADAPSVHPLSMMTEAEAHRCPRSVAPCRTSGRQRTDPRILHRRTAQGRSRRLDTRHRHRPPLRDRGARPRRGAHRRGVGDPRRSGLVDAPFRRGAPRRHGGAVRRHGCLPEGPRLRRRPGQAWHHRPVAGADRPLAHRRLRLRLRDRPARAALHCLLASEPHRQRLRLPARRIDGAYRRGHARSAARHRFRPVAGGI